MIRVRYELSSIFLVSKGIDDPVNASPVHLFAGLLGSVVPCNLAVQCVSDVVCVVC
jgi:ammonia channel protein AmtB